MIRYLWHRSGASVWHEGRVLTGDGARCTVHGMSTYKRRIVYLSDEEWRVMGARAMTRKLTISAFLREAIRSALLSPPPALSDGFGHPVAAPKPTQSRKPR